MLNGFLGLRHNAVIGRHHQDNDISTLGTASTHGGKRRVARGIQEGHHAVIGFYVVGTDMLGNTTGLAGSNLGATDVIQQRGFTVVNVTHHADNRCPLDFLFA